MTFTVTSLILFFFRLAVNSYITVWNPSTSLRVFMHVYRHSLYGEGCSGRHRKQIVIEEAAKEGAFYVHELLCFSF